MHNIFLYLCAVAYTRDENKMFDLFISLSEITIKSNYLKELLSLCQMC